MYWKYVAKRALYGVLMYIVMIFTYSILFNSVAEKTLRGQIDEAVAQEVKRIKNVSQDELALMIKSRREAKYAQYHLNEPLASRVFWRAVGTISFQFGNSTIIKASNGDRAVIGIVGEALPNTILLFTTEVVITVALGVWIGLYAARKPNGPLDRTTSMLTMITNGLPSWWLGMILLMFAAYTARIFPSGGLHSNPVPAGFAGLADLMWHLALPLLTLVFLGVWSTAYVTRNIVLSNLQEDFVMAARARGIPERRVLFGHTLRTSMPAIMTIAVLSLFASIAGNIIIEGIFGWPGIGNLYFIAVEQNDVPVLMSTLAIETLLTMVGFVILDLIYGFLDPRIKVGGKA